MKTIIAGSRLIYVNVSDMSTYVRLSELSVTEVVCGMARGVDLSGKRWADHYGINVTEFPTDWKQYGKRAGPLRNTQMAEYADALILIWDGFSRGSANMLAQAKSEGLEIREHVVKL